MADSTELKSKGWFLNLTAFGELCPSVKTADDIAKAALDLDLRQIGQSHLTDAVKKSKAEPLEGPIILQLQKVRNVGIPKESEEGGGGGARLLKLILTDGQLTVTAIELDDISGLSTNTPPGTKLKLTGKVSICNGHLLLSKTNCRILGGNVPSMVESWQMKRSLAAHSRDITRSAAGDSGGPPPFIPFGQRKPHDSIVRTDNFKSLDVGAKKKEADSEFEQQRRATIEAALQQSQTQQTTRSTTAAASSNKQPSDADIAQIVEMGFPADLAVAALLKTSGNVEQAINSLIASEPVNRPGPGGNGRVPGDSSYGPRSKGEGRLQNSRTDAPPRERERTGGRRGARRGQDTDDDQYMSSRPSAPATLFDFVTTKINSSASNASETEGSSAQSSVEPARAPSPGSSQKLPNNTPSSSAPLPPRLQRKQQKAEEEKSLKYYKPMDYMRQTAPYQRHTAAANNSTNTRTNFRSEDRPESSGGGRSSRVHDVNSRGVVQNRTLWTGEDMGNKGNQQGKEASHKTENGHDADNVVQIARKPGGDTTDRNWSAGSAASSQSGSNSVSMAATAMASLSLNSSVPASTAPNVLQSGGQNVRRRWNEGDECMARFWQDKQFYRARILNVVRRGKDPPDFLVLFVDYGNSETVSIGDIAELIPDRTWQQGGVQPVPQSNARSVPVAAYQPTTTAAFQNPPEPERSRTEMQSNNIYLPAYPPGTAVYVQQMAQPPPMPGILIQGPPSTAGIHIYPPTQQFQINTIGPAIYSQVDWQDQSGHTKRSHPPPAQVYLPPPLRK